MGHAPDSPTCCVLMRSKQVATALIGESMKVYLCTASTFALMHALCNEIQPENQTTSVYSYSGGKSI